MYFCISRLPTVFVFIHQKDKYANTKLETFE